MRIRLTVCASPRHEIRVATHTDKLYAQQRLIARLAGFNTNYPVTLAKGIACWGLPLYDHPVW